MDPSRTHLRPRATLPGDVCCGRSLLALTRQPDTEEMDTRQTDNQAQSKERAPGY